MIQYALLASIIFHVLILQIEIPEPKCVKPKPKKVAAKIKKDKSADQSTKLSELYIIDELEKLLREEKKNSEFGARIINNDCKKYYIGIGIVHSTFFNEITEVAKGGPADRAGIKVGDVLVNPDERIRNRYPEGAVIDIPVIRNGITINIRVTVGKICYDDKT